MGSEQEFRLSWNNFRPSLLDSFEASFDAGDFVDVTLSAEGQTLKAHRVFLSACSPYFKQLFKGVSGNYHPIVVLRDTSFEELKSLISFMYHGEVQVKQDNLRDLLAVAKVLKIKGLSESKFYNTCDDEVQSQATPQEDVPEQGPPPPDVPAFPYGLPNVGAYPQMGHPYPFKYKGRKERSYKSLPSKKSKGDLNSPHHPYAGRTPQVPTPPGHMTPPRDLHQATHPSPPHNGTSSSGNSSSHEDDKVVNLTVNNNSNQARDSSPPLIIAKMEVDEERNSPNPATPEEHEPEEKHHEEENGKHVVPVQPVGLPPYHFPTTKRDGYPGPSGNTPTTVANDADWRHRALVPSSKALEVCEPEGSHPVFNELFSGGGDIGGGNNSGGGGGRSVGGKKAVPTSCPVCHKVLSNAYNMRVHFETHQNYTYKCIICGMSTRTRDTMRKHCSNVHKLRNNDLKNSFKKLTKTGSKSPPVTPVKLPKNTSNITSPGLASIQNLSSLFLPQLTPPTMVPTSSGVSHNVARDNLDSIVNKLMNKQ